VKFKFAKFLPVIAAGAHLVYVLAGRHPEQIGAAVQSLVTAIAASAGIHLASEALDGAEYAHQRLNRLARTVDFRQPYSRSNSNQ
jgi:hypothetical protein